MSKGAKGNLPMRWAQRELWQQVAHVDPLQPNPCVTGTSMVANHSNTCDPDRAPSTTQPVYAEAA